MKAKRNPAKSAAPAGAGQTPPPATTPGGAAAVAPSGRPGRACWILAAISLLLAAVLGVAWVRARAVRPWLAATCFTALDELAGCYNRLADRDGELGAIKGLTALVEKGLLPDEAGVGAARLVTCGTFYARRAVLEEDLKQSDGSRQSYAEAARLLRAVGWQGDAVTPEALRTYVGKLDADRRDAASTNRPPAMPDFKLGTPRPTWR